jgi:hypothetical protein
LGKEDLKLYIEPYTAYTGESRVDVVDTNQLQNRRGCVQLKNEWGSGRREPVNQFMRVNIAVNLSGIHGVGLAPAAAGETPVCVGGNLVRYSNCLLLRTGLVVVCIQVKSVQPEFLIC